MKFKILVVTIIILLIVLVNMLPLWAETAEEWKLKGNEYLNKQEYDKALECFIKSLEIDPNYARSIHNMGVAYAGKKEYEKALEYFDKAIALVKSGKDTSSLPVELSYIGKAQIFQSLKKYEEVIKCYDKILEIDPKCFSAWYNKGIGLYNLDKIKEALECFEECILLNPNDENSKKNKELCLDKLNISNSNETSFPVKSKNLAVNCGNIIIINSEDNAYPKLYLTLSNGWLLGYRSNNAGLNCGDGYTFKNDWGMVDDPFNIYQGLEFEKKFIDDYYGEKVGYIYINSKSIKYNTPQELHRYQRNVDSIVQYQNGKKTKTIISNFQSEINIINDYSTFGIYRLLCCIYLDKYILQLNFDAKHDKTCEGSIKKEIDNIIKSIKVEIK